MLTKRKLLNATAALAILTVPACTTTSTTGNPLVAEQGITANFEQDRDSILAMTGDYKVTFDFTETVSFVNGYELKDP